MPKELPGFYYDAEKNRYFPYKGPIPGSSSSKPPPAPPPPDTQQARAKGLCNIQKLRPELLRARELCGDVFYSSKRKLSFRAEYQKRHASQPLIWKYKGTRKMANISMEHVVAEVISPHGIVERDVLLSGGLIGLLCAFQVGKDREEFDSRQIYKVDSAWPVNLNQLPRHQELLRHVGSLGSGQPMASDVSCVAASRNSSTRADGTMSKHFVITTLGNAHTPGCVYILDWSKPLDFPSPHPLGVELQSVAKFNQTLWTADCDPQGSRAVVGTNRGAALLDIETKAISWVLRSKSDVLSVQFDHSGHSIHCGLRNGAILTVDTRQRQIRNARESSGISMSSSVCSLASLKLWDQYMLGSSMDGSMKLYDSRLIKRGGAVQSYEGNVNSHTRIQIGVDPSEKVVLSGGEDFCLRMWNIKSGEMLFKERFMNTIPSAVCWPRSGEDASYWQDHCSGAWLGSYEGIFYMDWL